MKLKPVIGFLLASVVAISVAAAEPKMVAGKIEFSLNGLSFVLNAADNWSAMGEFDTPTTHSTYRGYIGKTSGRIVEVSAANTPTPTANIESVSTEYQEHLLSAGRVKLLGYRRGMLAGLPTGFFETEFSENGRTEHGVTALTVLEGQSYTFAMRTTKGEDPNKDPVFKALLASVKIIRNRAKESRVPVPLERQKPDQIIGNPRLEAELSEEASFSKNFPTTEEVLARLGPPEGIFTEEGLTVFHYSFGRYNYLNNVGFLKTYALKFSANGRCKEIRRTEKRVTEPFMELKENPIEEPIKSSKPKPVL